MNPRHLISIAATAGFVVLAFGSADPDSTMDDDYTGIEAPEPAPAGPEIHADMQAFLGEFQGDKAAVMGAVESRAVDKATIWDDSEHMPGVNYVEELKNVSVVERKDEDAGPCYRLRADEFPDRPDDHTIHFFKICWSDAGITHVEELVFGQKL